MVSFSTKESNASTYLLYLELKLLCTLSLKIINTLTSFQSSGYRVVLLLGQLRPQYPYPHAKKSATPIVGFIGLAIALPPPSVHEVRLETDMFVTRLSFDFKIAHCEAK